MEEDTAKFRFIEQAIVGWGHVNYGVIATGNHWICYAALCNSPTDALMGLDLWFFAETYRFASIFTAQFSNLLGGVMTPPYDWCILNSSINRNLTQ